MTPRPPAATRTADSPSDPKQVEVQLQAFSRTIDPILRKHFAHRRLRKLLRPPRSPQEKSQTVALWVPSKWSLLTGVAVLLALPGAGTQIPVIAWWPWIVALLAAVLFERRLLPRLSFSGYRFGLMRLVARDENQGEFPDQYLRAEVANSASGFGWQGWKAGRSIEPGDIVVAVSDRSGKGAAIIPLRIEGPLPVISWFRDLYQEGVFPPLSDEVKELAMEFDRLCDLYMDTGAQAERQRALRSAAVAPPPTARPDPERAWQSVILDADTRARLMAMAEDFADGKPTAPRGLLLYGPPGTGKTLIAKALAESLGCAFFPLSLPDLKATYVGESGERVKALWDKAQAEPRAVIFVDECEGVLTRRGGTDTDRHTEDIVNTFIARWDGFSKQTSVLVIGATNRQELIDPAVLSRFDEQVRIGLPDATQRPLILQRSLEALGHATALPDAAGPLTEGLSGRDLSGLARRLARDQERGQSLDAALIERHVGQLRQQGSTATDAEARWDTLVLPEQTLRELKATAGLLAHAEAFQQRGISIPRGLLLYGPPGTGKTQVARTLANETGLRFIAASTADIKQGYLGQSGQKVRELFERAREAAPALLFIDELDILAGTRGGSGTDVMQTEIIGQLLQEMDGAKAQPQHVFVLAATNRINQIDAAVLSRLPKQIEIPLPDEDGTQQLLRVMLARKPLAFELERVLPELAQALGGRSGRDLRNAIEQAEQQAVMRAIEAGEPDQVALKVEDFGVGLKG